MPPANRPRVAIIGCGYVGGAVGRALATEGFDCVGTTTSRERLDEIDVLGIRSAVLRLADVDELHALLADRDVVLLTVAAGRRDTGYRAVYLDGARHLLRAIEGTAVRRLIYTSSTGVYGQDDGSWVDENSLTEPTSDNGRTLLEAERTLLDGGSRIGLNVTVLRLAGIYGPGRGPQNTLSQVAGSTRTDGDVYLNLIHVDDIVSAMRRLIGVPYHGVLNLSDGAPTTRREYYDRLISNTGLAPIRWEADPSSPVRGKRVSNERIKRVLDLSLLHPTH